MELEPISDNAKVNEAVVRAGSPGSVVVPGSVGSAHDAGALTVNNPITAASAMTLPIYFRPITGTVCSVEAASKGNRAESRVQLTGYPLSHL
ncbi:hypothetical protein I545_3099 [Mycobacterium kansasii 662]|uniref:Uncharacterized protein n=1 Tax=Mycobacterium kansasii 662 TaxID=1299326 RepID=X7ZEY9_MYCKA|nr:hypothetical protein I545_3099 [Mycobacterium kansasii 662]KEP39656.1 hypothetical protein MKSMC1_52080 [Mycobacterium kansasii]